jgi:hypothetical protein
VQRIFWKVASAGCSVQSWSSSSVSGLDALDLIMTTGIMGSCWVLAFSVILIEFARCNFDVVFVWNLTLSMLFFFCVNLLLNCVGVFCLVFPVEY